MPSILIDRALISSFLLEISTLTKLTQICLSFFVKMIQRIWFDKKIVLKTLKASANLTDISITNSTGSFPSTTFLSSGL